MNWLRQHLAAAADALRHLLRSPGNFILNVLVVSIALALPFAGLSALENVRPISDQMSVEPEISIFMKMDASRDAAQAMGKTIAQVLKDSDTVGRVEFIPREKAFDAMKNKSGLADVLATLGSNPLPDSFVLRLPGFQNAMDAGRVDDIAQKLTNQPGVDTVQIDSAWVKRLAALLRILRLVLLFLGITLGAVVVAVVFNTIRLQVMTQREEIEVSRLLGATNAFIHRPFYYTGALLGLCAGAVALGLVIAAQQPLNAAILDFAHLYASEFQLALPSAMAICLLLAVSALLGLFGAMMSVRRHLARMQ
ncbi:MULTISPECIES: permease-like cell division protein FtsX [unclassified Herbaspirillum]|uniref:permease-like cell division protein FtsX n=1 Tax=unclassified Herbaspirillum TaxID=2624150 RepID=UPI00114E3967|nr:MULTISPECIES: permease-like cell division protein FtsX [unclassified Herbaspirillum]MBB5390363.1 cell division transport system permease protein [Herbaspirillum sp. SJZ102]TQK09140.1 cell division transport system permease protein [Herbaspirillum sp. SJZ130]TQK14173.1 cell division transport system permease protein [Herbaspirillum sp. SJZ106]TWC69872.1 cell division transport system permease protein [Herbaspirillum sp. SJZ099]